MTGNGTGRQLGARKLEMRKPEISVLMTVYNTAEYLDEAIRSVLAQRTARTWELLIADDGSTDGSLGIARGYEARHGDCVRVLRHPGGANGGISRSRNLALGRAQGGLIAFLDSDDVWLPEHCETLAGVLDHCPEAAMVYGAAERWVDFDAPFDDAAARASDWGRNYIPPLLPAGQQPGMLPEGALVEWFHADESLVPCICSVMVRAWAARAVGGFCDAFRGLYDDQAFHARVCRGYGVYAVDRCVARYRQHDRSCCAGARADEAAGARERRRFLRFLAEQRLAAV